LGALKRSVSTLARHQPKLWEIDHHMAVGIAGLTADARSLAKYMQNECLQHAYVYGCPLPPHQLLADLADKHQRTTQTYVRRPFGVGLLVAAVDPTRQSCHLYQTCPSGNVYELYASAMGARSQSARTYLEKHYQQLDACTTDELIVHALQALVGCVSGDEDLTPENTSIALVGLDQTFSLLEGEALAPYLAQLPARAAPAEETDAGGDAPAGGGGGDEPAAMET
jgi:20S proteasome subunit alpha 6